MRDIFRKVVNGHPIGAEVARLGNVEINLVVASERRIRQGFLINPYKPHQGSLPVKAFFKSHQADPRAVKYPDNGGHVTGHHSAVNYDFYDPIVRMIKVGSRLGIGSQREKLGLIRIEPTYRFIDPVVVFHSGSARKVVHYRPESEQGDEQRGL